MAVGTLVPENEQTPLYQVYKGFGGGGFDSEPDLLTGYASA